MASALLKYGLSRGPYGAEAVGVGLEQATVAVAPQVPDRSAVGVHPEDVGVDDDLVVRAVEGVIERRAVGSYVDPGNADEGSVVHEGEPATGLDAVAEPLLLAALLDVGAVGIAVGGSYVLMNPATLATWVTQN
jgi:hypothetical protein